MNIDDTRPLTRRLGKKFPETLSAGDKKTMLGASRSAQLYDALDASAAWRGLSSEK
jgi:hypothetical protein